MTEDIFFGPNREITKASSPGRMDVMGGIADYSGSLLLQMPIRERTTISLAKRTDNIIRVYSTTAAKFNLPAEISLPVESLFSPALKDYTEARKFINALSAGDWAIYILGCFYLLYKEKGFTFYGADVLVQSEVPFGKGVSSSAAIEVATFMAIDKAYGLKLGKLELPILAQQMENLVVGAPCGLMDQLASYLGEENKLLPIVCQPVKVYPAITIPDNLHFVAIDSGVKHSVQGNAYGKVRVAAFMGYTIIAHALNITTEELQKAKVSQDWGQLPYGGYLANISVDEFKTKYADLLPEKISGREFIQKYQLTLDVVTTIKEEDEYLVKACAAHPVYENYRVHRFQEILELISRQGDATEALLIEAGNLMYGSHTSYSACGLGNKNTDELVEMAKATGPAKGIYGAKITGGGSGGTVCLLAFGRKGIESARTIHQSYQERHQLQVQFFQNSSNGGYFS